MSVGKPAGGAVRVSPQAMSKTLSLKFMDVENEHSFRTFGAPVKLVSGKPIKETLSHVTEIAGGAWMVGGVESKTLKVPLQLFPEALSVTIALKVVPIWLLVTKSSSKLVPPKVWS